MCMKRERFRFLELLGNIDDELIYRSCQPWEKKTGNIMGIHAGKIAACAVLVLVLCIAAIFHQQVEAAIRSFSTKIAEMLGVSGNLAPYTEIIGASQTEQGVTVTLEEVILAENRLYIAMHMEWDDSLELEPGVQSPSLNCAYDPRINREEIRTKSSGTELFEPEEKDDSQRVLATFIYADDDFPYQINEIEIEAQVIGVKNFGEEGMPFTFRFSASKEELEKDTYNTAINYEIKAEQGLIFYLNRLQLNKIFSRISVSTNNEPGQMPLYKKYRLLGKDSEGNSLRYKFSEEGNNRGFFESEETLPSANCQWIELQLYEAELPMSGNAGTAQDTIQVQPGIEERIDMECNVYNVDEIEYVPVGEKVRISLPRMSETDVEAMVAAKGTENITWGDFARYPHTDIGSGQYVFEYPLTESARLYLTGSSLQDPPQGIYIIRRDGTKKEFKR